MPFTNPIVAGTTLVRQAINSPDYVAGVSGWSINRDGTAEFSDMTARGSVQAGTVLLDSDGVSVNSRVAGTSGITVTTVIPTPLYVHYAGQGFDITTAIIYYSESTTTYFYECSSGTMRVRGIVTESGIVETSREFLGTDRGKMLRSRTNAIATGGGQTPTSTTPALIAGTQATIPVGSLDPNVTVQWECSYTADMEQITGGNTTTQVELYLNGAPVVGSRKLTFNPGNTSTVSPAHRIGGLTSFAIGTLDTSTDQMFALYGSRLLGAGTNRINPGDTGLTIKIYY